MTVRTKKEIVLFFRYLSKFGFLPGLLLYSRLKLFKAGTIKVPQIKFPVVLRRSTSDINVFEQVFVSGNYGFKIPYVPGTIVDCGANIGLASIFFANKFPDARIIAIEPESSNFEILKVNTASYANIELINKAIWHRNTSLVIDDPGVGHFGFKTKEKEEGISATIDAVTIVDVMEKYGLNSIDLLKIDIEGAELELFAYNFDGWLSKTRCLVIEVHEWFRKGASKPFIKAISKYDFSISSYGESYVCYRD